MSEWDINTNCLWNLKCHSLRWFRQGNVTYIQALTQQGPQDSDYDTIVIYSLLKYLRAGHYAASSRDLWVPRAFFWV